MEIKMFKKTFCVALITPCWIINKKLRKKYMTMVWTVMTGGMGPLSTVGIPEPVDNKNNNKNNDRHNNDNDGKID